MSGDDLAGVQACIQAYLDGLYKGDTGLLFKTAFHPDAHMNAAELAGERVHWNMEEFQKVVEGRGAPEAAGYPRKERIVSIDFAGPDTANVKVEVLVGKRDFTDLLACIRVNGEWKIIAKTYCLTREYDTKEDVLAAVGA
ncbi:MAG: hypothetical protein COW30_10600 [Rhodospirillales bacterium CG15_BIG_FIL_POST_REV_8_21_14_020_66_15]|nr:MAG: hypothetical protein COW30_10600 [Rhodospirillales bacterium CG15_BIG_FIL_POST_REV_8_21_14_020_66_15]